MMLDDCKDLSGVLTGIADALKPNGRLLLSMNNPYALAARGKVDDYFASGRSPRPSAPTAPRSKSPSTTGPSSSG